MSNYRNEIKKILIESGVKKSTKILNSIIKVFEKNCNKEVDNAEESDVSTGFPRDSKEYIKNVKIRDKNSKNVVVSNSIPNTDNVPSFNIERDGVEGKKE